MYIIWQVSGFSKTYYSYDRYDSNRFLVLSIWTTIMIIFYINYLNKLAICVTILPPLPICTFSAFEQDTQVWYHFGVQLIRIFHLNHPNVPSEMLRNSWVSVIFTGRSIFTSMRIMAGNFLVLPSLKWDAWAGAASPKFEEGYCSIFEDNSSTFHGWI